MEVLFSRHVCSVVERGEVTEAGVAVGFLCRHDTSSCRPPDDQEYIRGSAATMRRAYATDIGARFAHARRARRASFQPAGGGRRRRRGAARHHAHDIPAAGGRARRISTAGETPQRRSTWFYKAGGRRATTLIANGLIAPFGHVPPSARRSSQLESRKLNSIALTPSFLTTAAARPFHARNKNELTTHFRRRRILPRRLSHFLT